MKVKTKKVKDRAVITVVFDRDMDGDEIEIMLQNFAKQNIKVDPRVDIKEALAQQIALELQHACDHGMSGSFLVKKVKLNKGFKK
jgi:hypothetical protein